MEKYDKNSSDIFNLKRGTEDGKQIFSIGGSPSIRINRRRNERSSVYPYGSNDMSIKPILPTVEHEDVPKMLENDEETDKVPIDDEKLDVPDTPIEEAAIQQNVFAKRNILTGEGIDLPDNKRGKRGIRKKKTLWTW